MVTHKFVEDQVDNFQDTINVKDRTLLMLYKHEYRILSELYIPNSVNKTQIKISNRLMNISGVIKELEVNIKLGIKTY